jgi:flagellar biosynthetic protein FliP
MAFGALLGVTVALALVLGVLALAMRLLRRFSTLRIGGRSRLPFEVVQRIPLAPRQGLAVVRIGERALVVSVGDGGVRAVTELTDEERAALIAPAPAHSVARSPLVEGDFVGRLRAALAQNIAPALRERVGGAVKTLVLVLAFGLAMSPLHAQSAQSPNPAAAVVGAATQTGAAAAGAQIGVPGTAPRVSLQVGGGNASDLRISGTVGAVVFMGLMVMLPTLLLLMTSFTRILIVLHFLRQALGTQSAPPGHMLAALALLLTGFVMAPTLDAVNTSAVKPWMDGQIAEGEMLKAGVAPFREFMLRQTPEADLVKFVEMSDAPPPETAEDVSLPVLMSAFATSELRAAFRMGFAIFLPFIVIDLVVSAVLTSMGMFMLPPTMIALPCKLLLFVLVDGWTLTVQGLVASFS